MKIHFLSSNGNVKNIVLPQIVPFDFGDEEINAMDMVSASCTVNKGDLPVKISWQRDNRKLTSNDGISISRTNQRISILSIESVRGRHSGNYTCTAENAAGIVNYTASLRVNGIRELFETDTSHFLSIFCFVFHIDFIRLFSFFSCFFYYVQYPHFRVLEHNDQFGIN